MNTNAASAAMARAAAEPSRSALRTRVVSAALLAPLVLLLVILGGWAFAAMVALAVSLLALEWSRLTAPVLPPPRVEALLLVLGLTSGVLIAAAGAWSWAWLGLLAALLPTLARPRGRGWIVLGVAWFGLPALALIALRDRPDGLWLIAWLLAGVWACDIGAYFAGRRIGGPRLAPRISPGKTWAGLAGGMVSSAIACAAVAWFAGWDAVAALGLAGAGLAAVAQAGDLAESAVKRRFGAKDSGSLIPGHGGLFDRVDGLLAGAGAMALGLAVVEGVPWP